MPEPALVHPSPVERYRISQLDLRFSQAWTQPAEPSGDQTCV